MREQRRLVALCAIAFIAAACSDAAEYGYRPRRLATDEPEQISAPSEPSDASAGEAGAAKSPAAKVDPWKNSAPYSLLTPSEESTDHHLGAKHLGDDCMSCHTGAGAPRFALAGTVFATSAGGEGASRVQVRVVAPNGDEVALVGTDSSGNFWLRDAPELPPGSSVGIRDEITTRTMASSVGGNAACNQGGCHSAARPLHLRD